MDSAMAFDLEKIDTNCLQDRDRLVHNMCFAESGPRMNREEFYNWCHTEWPGPDGRGTRAKVMLAHWQLTKESNPRRKYRREVLLLIEEAERDRQEANRNEEQPTTTDDNDVPPPTVEEHVSQPIVEEDEATQAPDTDMTRQTVEVAAEADVEADVENVQCLIS